MVVAEIMTQPVVSVSSETTIAEAAQIMLQHRISGLPVVDDHQAVVGIVTEGDLLRRAETGTERRHHRLVELLLGPGHLAAEYVEAHARKVGEVMSTDVACVSPRDSLPQVVRLMEKRQIKRVPVVENSRIVGIVSRANLIQALITTLVESAPEPAASDEQIRDLVLAEITKQPWGPRSRADVHVKDKVASFYGSITDERERIALTVVAENIVGVKAVHDNLVWVDPTSGYVIPAVGSKPPRAA
jgi:CBS domain-containing protein